MYPATYFGLFPPFPRQDTVFVAMSFDEPFRKRWTDVIERGIRAVKRDGKPFEPVRVDARNVSDSILTEILSGIGTARLVLADVTTIGYVEGRAARNANVMYEVGIAHASRLPEEVLLFRSDRDPLLFDLANVRVNEYAPDEKPDEARKMIGDSIVGALRELDLRRALAVRRATDALDITSWEALAKAHIKPLKHPNMSTMGQALGNASAVAAIRRLLELGALRTSYLPITPENYERMKQAPSSDVLNYECIEFGSAVLNEAMTRLGVLSPDVLRLLQQDPQEPQGT